MKKVHLFILSFIVAALLTYLFYFFFGYSSLRLVNRHWNKFKSRCGENSFIYPAFSISLDRTSFQKTEQNSQYFLAMQMRKKHKVFCFTPTKREHIFTRVAAIKNTWSKHCNKHVFYGYPANEKVPIISVGMEEGYSQLTAKTMRILKHLAANYVYHYDWFAKFDDDAFVMVENLRYLLSHFNPDEPVYFGHHFKPYVKQGYMSGGAGYVFSNTALRLYADYGVNNTTLCRDSGGAEDVAIGQCFESLGIKPGISLDILDRQTFHPFNPGSHFLGQFPGWYLNYSQFPAKAGPDCCSEFSISYHNVDPTNMHVFYHLLYRTQLYGIKQGVPKTDYFFRHG